MNIPIVAVDSIKIDTKEKAALLLELVTKAAVSGPQAKILGELYDEAVRIVKYYSG